MDVFLNLLCLLQAVYGCGKNCHYFAYGENFYALHKFADDLTDEILDWMDEIIEGFYLGRGVNAPQYADILAGAAKLVSRACDDNRENFSSLAVLVEKILQQIQEIMDSGDITAGEQDILSPIARQLQQRWGFLNRMTMRSREKGNGANS